MPSRLQKAIGLVKDQTSIHLAKVNGSSNLELAILKATTHDNLPIDERYIHEILNLISSNKTYASACAKAISKRVTRTHNWKVALKSLILVLRIFQDGDPYFPREILHVTKKGGKLLDLSDFSDYSDSNPLDYTAFIKTFGLYLQERLECFITGKLQRRYNYDKKEDSYSFKKRVNDYVRDMKPTMLIDRIVYWQRLLERAIATQPTGVAKDNQLVNITVYAVVRESFELYRDISSGLGYLIDNFLQLQLQYESRVSVFEICLKAKKQFEELDEFYTMCKTIGVGKSSEYPTIMIVSGDLIESMQENLEEKMVYQTPEETELLSRSHESYEEQSHFSGVSSPIETVSDKISESGSDYKSLDEKSPNISPELEACSGHLEKMGSTGSLPVTNVVADLISFDACPANDDHEETQEQESKQDLLESNLANELPNTSSSNLQSESNSNNYCKPVLASKHNHQQSIHQTYILSNTLDASTAITLRNQPQPQLPIINHYNPFLQDLHDIPADNSCIASYWAQTRTI